MREEVVQDETRGIVYSDGRYSMRIINMLNNSLYKFELAIQSRLKQPKSINDRKIRYDRLQAYQNSENRFQRAGLDFERTMGCYFNLVPKEFRDILEIGIFKERLNLAETIFNEEFYYIGL